MADDADVFTKLPSDVVFQILVKLPTKSLLQLRRVSKFFNPLILDSHFLNLHHAGAADNRVHVLKYESTDYAKAYFSFHAEKTLSSCKILQTPFESFHGYLRVVGSERGVLCLLDTNYYTFIGTVILWNPFIGKFMVLPRPIELNCYITNVSHMAVGFGFDLISLDFKVVMILYSCDNEHELIMPKALIYCVKTGSWRSSGIVVPCFMPRKWSSSVFVNGAVHWLAYKEQPRYNAQPNCIMGFDVVEEVFKLMELPQNLGQNPRDLRLCCCIDEKSVALFVSYRENMGEAWDLWLMNEYGNVESWTRNRTIVLEQVFFPLKIVNGGDILAATCDEKLVSIDVEKGEVTDLQVSGVPASFNAASIMPSLALIDIGEQLPSPTCQAWQGMISESSCWYWRRPGN